MNVLVAVEGTVWQNGIRTVLASEKQISVTTLDPSRQQLPPNIPSRFDIVVADARQHSPVQVAAGFNQRFPGSRQVLITRELTPDDVVACRKRGVCAFIDEAATREQLLIAVHAASRGDLYLTSPAAGAFARSEVSLCEILAPSERDQEKLKCLSEREMEVLKLVARGMPNKAIAEELFISEKTVKNHLYSIFKKTGVRDRTQAAMMVIKGLMAKDNGTKDSRKTVVRYD